MGFNSLDSWMVIFLSWHGFVKSPWHHHGGIGLRLKNPHVDHGVLEMQLVQRDQAHGEVDQDVGQVNNGIRPGRQKAGPAMFTETCKPQEDSWRMEDVPCDSLPGN